VLSFCYGVRTGRHRRFWEIGHSTYAILHKRTQKAFEFEGFSSFRQSEKKRRDTPPGTRGDQAQSAWLDRWKNTKRSQIIEANQGVSKIEATKRRRLDRVPTENSSPLDLGVSHTSSDTLTIDRREVGDLASDTG
jgi:hypothetical protein